MATSGGPNIVKDGLVLCYDMADKGSYVSGSSTIYDLSGKGNHGEVGSGLEYTNDAFGTLEFRDNDAILVGTGSDYNSLTNVTVQGWMRAFDVSSYEYLLSNSRDCCGTYYGYELRINNGDFEFQIWNSSSADARTIGAAYNELDRWYCVHGTYDGSVIKVYVDGEEKNTTNTALGIGTPASFPLYVGRMGSNILQLSGSIAHVSIYNRALTDTEIQQNYKALKRRFGI
jgi:hypothetical protein